MKNVPYSRANSSKPRDEITKLLIRLGCTKVGFMDELEEHAVVLFFVHRGNPVRLKVSALGWAEMYLKDHPKTPLPTAIKQGLIAINSILRDWVKGMVTAIETNAFTADALFLPFVVSPKGTTLAESGAEQAIKRITEENS